MDINLRTLVPIEVTGRGLPSNPQCLELFNNIQGNFVKEHGRDNVLLLFLVFSNSPISEIKRAIADIYNDPDLITSCNQQLEEGNRYSTWRNSELPKRDFDEKLFVNFALTSKGYMYLGVSKDQFPHDEKGFFTQGRTTGKHWDKKNRADIHAMMLLALDHENLPDLGSPAKWARVAEEKKTPALKKAADIKNKWTNLKALSHTEVGRTIYDKKIIAHSGSDDPRKPVEHFGFIDGISNPLFFSNELPPSNKNYDPLTPLDAVLTKDPQGGQYAYGSYLVFLKLEQDVDRFTTLAKGLGGALNEGQELAEAYVMGRFRDGTPVVVQDRAGLGAINDFAFPSIDRDGMRCPLHAHIRKVNRRRGSIESEDRIVRRGITYGDREIQYDDKGNLRLGQIKGSVGLLFMSFQNDIAKFDTLFSIWTQENEPRIGAAFDPVIGHGNNVQRWPTYGTAPDSTPFRFADVVTEKGGQYFFAPSIPYLKTL